MDPVSITRRHVLALGLISGATSWSQIVDAHAHARRSAASKPQFEFFDAATAAEIEAIAAQIIPSDGTPGAREAGVIYFIDRALAGFDEDKRPAYREGIAEIEKKRLELFPDSKSIAALSSSDQARLVHAIETTKFFELVRLHTMLGFFGDPSYGGNRNNVGWQLIGFQGHHAYQQPFGYYEGRE